MPWAYKIVTTETTVEATATTGVAHGYARACATYKP